MSFNIGDIVIPIVDMTLSGYTIPTTGASGTVLSRKLVGRTQLGEDLYSYYVDMIEDYTVESSTISNFWFEETQLQGGTTEAFATLDLNEINYLLSSGTAVLNSSQSNINNTLTMFPRQDAYYEQANMYKGIVDDLNTAVSNRPIDTSTPSGVSTTINPLSQETKHYATSAKILSELTDNLKGYSDVINEIKLQEKTMSQQAILQSDLLREESSLNEKAYFETYMPESKNAFVPSDSPTPDAPPPTDNTNLPSADIPDEIPPGVLLDLGND